MSFAFRDMESKDTLIGSNQPLDTAGATPTKVTIKNVDMTEEMQQESIEIANKALEQFQVEKDIAAWCKREFDKKYGPTWHVVVGKNFGSYVTHGELNTHIIQGSLDGTREVRADLDGVPLNRDEAFHLLLHWASGAPHMEVMIG